MMQISIIAAMGENRIIGANNTMPWHLPADLAHFKTLTWGKPIIMGRKTFESIGKPLPGRDNIIITRNPDYHVEGCLVFHSIEAALKAYEYEPEVMIIGGANLYAQSVHLATTLYLTRIHESFDGDAAFPEINDAEWKLVDKKSFEPDEKNPHAYSFVTLKRI